MTNNECAKLSDLHKSVLFEELVNSIDIRKDKQNIIVDCTLWMWGHASEILSKLNPWDIFVWFDADIRNLNLAKPYLEEKFKNSWVKLIFINDNFLNLENGLTKNWIEKITWIYYDFWLSSLHVDEADRWFSFMQDWPLDMRFDNTKWITASEIVNSYKKDDLIKIFREYSEDPNSRKIAEHIFQKRKRWFKHKTTSELVRTIEEVTKFPKTKIRIFQALRIEVNKELEVIQKSLIQAINLLDVWWKIFAISFHSLEDRIVKNIFRDESKDCLCKEIVCVCKHTKKIKILTKKPIIPSENEVKENPRSRSAKARLAEKI